MDGQPFYLIANPISIHFHRHCVYLLFSRALRPNSAMNNIPRQLLSIKRDWQQFKSQNPNVLPSSAVTVERRLAYLLSLKTRLTRCRHAATGRAARLRASLLRSVFSGWRGLIRRVVQHPPFAVIAVNHLRILSRNLPPSLITTGRSSYYSSIPRYSPDYYPILRTRPPSMLVGIRGIHGGEH